MKWNLILKLSLFGLAMAFATVYFIPSNIEPFCWLIVFVICAWQIAKKCHSRYFLHGFLVSIFNSAWITTVHIFLFDKYIANHPNELEMMKRMPLPDSAKLMMLMTGPIVGIVSGLVLGLFSFLASKIIKRKAY